MKIVCLDAATLGADTDLSIFEKLGDFTRYEMTAPEQTALRLKGADVVITNKVVIDRAVTDATSLKLICVSGTGVNNVDLAAAKEKNIAVKNVAGYSTNSVTQHTFACLFTLLNQIKFYGDYAQNGEWVKSEIFTNLSAPITELNGKNFGVVGLGEIGRNVARIAAAFGANVSYYSTSGANTNAEFKRRNLDELLQTCDVVSIHAPLNENTRNLIKERELNLMKSGAVLMNFGRGGIVDESAVARAVDERNLRFAADVLEREPMAENHPFLSVKNGQNLLITPHVAWGSVEARKTLIKKIAENIENFVKERG